MAEGKVWLVGAGPGEAGLLTVKARELIKKADFIAYDALVGEEILCLLPETTQKISVGKRFGRHSVPQEEINQILLSKAMEGKRVVRLKGGDPFVFGRGGEELELLKGHGISFEVVPGITSAVAVPTYAGIPVTHRDYTSSFHVITGHPRKDGKDRIDYEALARMDATLIFLMSISCMQSVMEKLLLAGMDENTPAAVLEQGTRYCQRRVVSTIRNLAADAKNARIGTPAIIMVGKVCQLSEQFSWYEKRPLAGHQILVTRSQERAGRLATELRELGAEVLEVPMIETRLLDIEKIDFEELVQQCSGQKVWLTFTSPSSVEHFFEAMALAEMDLRMLVKDLKNIRFAAVGQATAAELRKYGWQTDILPAVFDGTTLGKTLASVAEPDAKICIIGANERSAGLTEELRLAGIDWSEIPLYETINRQHDILTELLRQKMGNGSLELVTFTSVSTVRGFTRLLKGFDFTNVQAVCIGKQTANEAEKFGMRVEVAEEASIQSMVDKLKELMKK